MAMQAELNAITDSLGRELALYQELVQVAGEEREILLTGDHDRLMGTAERKLTLCRNLAQVQESRRRLMQKLSPAEDRALKLSDLADWLPAPERGPFRSLVARLAGLAKELGGLNQRNKSFLEEALGTVEDILGMIMNAGRPSGYGLKGQRSAPSAPRLVAREV
jgi:flagellar biosynthesis/type III secretory pathway chaperone